MNESIAYAPIEYGAGDTWDVRDKSLLTLGLHGMSLSAAHCLLVPVAQPLFEQQSSYQLRAGLCRMQLCILLLSQSMCVNQSS